MNANESVLQRHVVNLSQGKWLEERRISARFRCGGTMPRACPPSQLKQGHPWPHVAQPLSSGALEMRDMGPWEQRWGWG